MRHDILRFRGGMGMAFIPVVVFLAFCVLYFVVFKAFDMTALAMGGFVALLIGALFAKPYKGFWEAVMKGVGSPTSVSIVMILFIVGMISELIKVTDVSSGFVWLASTIGVGSATFTLFTFVAVCVISMSTGSSIGTMFTAFPIFYPAGVLIGADPTLLAGAIISGAVFGDNIAPISDTTIISASTQRSARTGAVADIGGVLRERARYALLAAGLSAVVFLLLSLGTGSGSAASGDVLDASSAKPLLMLIPVALMLIVAMRFRDIFLAVTVGLAVGTVTALLSGLITFADVVGVEDDVPTGFLVGGVTNMLGTVALVVSVFGIMGVLTEAGVLDRVIERLSRGSLASTPRGAEVAIAAGSSVTTLLFGGVNSAAMLTFGPVANDIGERVGLHPYRRANVMDCFALGLASIIPVLSAYLFIGALLTDGHEGVPSLSTAQIFPATLYPLILTAVLIVSVWTGWGRRFEAADGSPVRSADQRLDA